MPVATPHHCSRLANQLSPPYLAYTAESRTGRILALRLGLSWTASAQGADLHFAFGARVCRRWPATSKWHVHGHHS